VVQRRQRSCLQNCCARLTDECSSVGRTQLSDTGVGDELTVVGQVTRGVPGQGPADESRNLERYVLPHSKPVQLAEHRRDNDSRYWLNISEHAERYLRRTQFSRKTPYTIEVLELKSTDSTFRTYHAHRFIF